MIYVPLQDLHLVQSMNWISELSRRYHSVRMHILTPYGEVFPTRSVGNEYLLEERPKSGFSLFPLFVFCSLRLGSLGAWVFHANRKEIRMTFGKPTKEEANKSISVDHKMAKF